MMIMQMSALSMYLGSFLIIPGGVAVLACWARVDQTTVVKYGRIALYACTVFFAYHLKRHRIVIDQSRRELRVRACWCFFFWKDELTYGFDALQYRTFDTEFGETMRLTFPDSNRVPVYDDRAVAILIDVLPEKPRHPYEPQSSGSKKRAQEKKGNAGPDA